MGIEDEHDVGESDIVIVGEGEALMAGRARIEDLNEAWRSDWTDSHETIKGLVDGMAGRVPEEGNTATG